MDKTLLRRLQALDPLMWINPGLGRAAEAQVPVRPEQVAEAEQNWRALAPLLWRRFPGLDQSGGTIASDLIEVA